MAPSQSAFRSRAASLLNPFASRPQDLNEKQEVEGAAVNEKGDGYAPEDDPLQASRYQEEARGQFGQRKVRSVPAWVHIDEDASHETDAASHLLPDELPTAQVAQHNHSPAVKTRNKPVPGRLYDSQREWAPPTLKATDTGSASRWRAFADASSYPAVTSNGGMIVDEEWLVQNGADYSRPWLADSTNEDGEMNGMHLWKSKRKAWWVRAQRTVLRNPMIPLIFRSIVFVFSAVALALAGSIHHLTDQNPISQALTTNMAVVVDTVALVYILYITYDEYTGKPLGLRSARSKLRLIFLDLFFIVFNSANLSIAFEGLHGGDGACALNDSGAESVPLICHRQKGLASVLLIALIAWLLNFCISVLRIVERVTQR